MAVEPKDPEQRRILRDLRQQGQSALTWGLPNPVTEAVVIGAGLLMREQMVDLDNEAAASNAVDIAARLIDKTTQRMAQADTFACKAGCNFCCYSAVAVSAPEAFRIARALVQADDAAGGIGREEALARCRAVQPASLQEVVQRIGPCALLVGGNCSVHVARPISCRQYFSTSAAACEAALLTRSNTFPFVTGAANAGNVARALLLGAAQSLGLQADMFEMSSAIVVALETPDAERRWLAGEDVMAGAVRLPRPPQMQQSVDRWAPMLKTFAEGA